VSIPFVAPLALESVMKARTVVWALVVAGTTFVASGPASAGLVNGNFATGDLSGWTASAIDQNGHAVTPLIAVGSSGGTHFAVFDTGTYAAGPFDSTLSQSFLVTATQPILSFDFNRLPALTSDATGTGKASFRDSFVASLFDGTQSFPFLLIDSSGAHADPFGRAPGKVTIGPSLNSPLDSTLGLDLSSLAGHALMLNLDVTSQDDGFRSVYDPTNFETSAAPKPNSIPEPSSVVLLLIGAIATLYYSRKRRG
jgi:hypothetical protein